MRIFKLTLSLFAAPLLSFCQMESGTITINASRSINLPPDQVAFNIGVSSSFNTSLEQVLAALQGVGVTAADLSSVGGGYYSIVGDSTAFPIGGGGAPLQWSFNVTVPFSKLQQTAAALVALEKTIGQSNSGLTLTFSISALQLSTAAQQAQCSLPGLISDAQAQARKLADAVGGGVGPIISLSDNSAPIALGIAPSGPGRVGFDLIVQVLPTTTITRVSCSITVQFKLVRFQQ